MQNHNRFKFINDLIKFAIFYYYHVLNYPVKPFATYLLMDYHLQHIKLGFLLWIHYFKQNLIQILYTFCLGMILVK